jgi:ribosomal protein S18 acetylase RimI-like enzyme
MISEANPSEHSVAKQIHAVSQAAYALEAERIGCAEFPPLRETLDKLRQCSDTFLVFQQAGRIVGALAFDGTSDPVLITRLVVSPEHLRRGIATALLTELERRLPAVRLKVSTALANTAAVSLYERLGYSKAEVTSAEGIALVRLIKASGSLVH